MAALVISISSDVSVESVGSSFPRVILIGFISIEVSVAPKVGADAVASPAGVLKLDTHSSSEDDPSESSPPLVSVALMVSPFLYSDDLESDIEMLERHVSPTTSTLEIPTASILPAPSVVTLSSEFPLAPIVAPSEIRHSSSDHSSSGHSISGHSLPGHASPDTTVVDSSTPPRFIYPPLSRTPRYSEAYLRWRCKSPTATVTSSIHATRALVLSRADLLPPRKRSSLRVNNKKVVAALRGSDHHCATNVGARLDAQQKKLNLLVLPITIIGSFPQTIELRRVRREYQAKKINL
ncbi:reverse transcriptase domain-containing protein [Tanacetum coccineum]